MNKFIPYIFVALFFIFIGLQIQKEITPTIPVCLCNCTPEQETIQDIQYWYRDKPSPADRIQYEDISVAYDRVSIRVPNARISTIADSYSMSPFIENESNTIQIVPESMDDIHVGDIVTYQKFSELKNKTTYIIHRAIFKGEDSMGEYILLKGDNNFYEDYEKVRWEDIKYITVGIIY